MPPPPRRLAALLLCLAAPAHAQRMGIERPERETEAQVTRPSAPSAPEPPPAPGSWYGAGAVVADTLAVGLVTTAVVSEKPILLLPGYLTYLAGAPINHLAHGQNLEAGLSLGLRVLPLVVGYVAVTTSNFSDEGPDGRASGCGPGCKSLIVWGMVVPVVVSALDDALLARHPERPRWPAGEERAKVSWAPQVSPLPGGGWSVGAAGGGGWHLPHPRPLSSFVERGALAAHTRTLRAVAALPRLHDAAEGAGG